MKTYLSITFFILAMLDTGKSGAETFVHSYFPRKHIPEFLVKRLDLASFRNSLGPRRELGRSTFYKMGVKHWNFTQNKAVYNSSEWHYSIRLIKISDINRDGIEDVEICFNDKAKKGSYNVQQPLLITRYSISTPPIAIKYKVFGCKSFK